MSSTALVNPLDRPWKALSPAEEYALSGAAIPSC